MSKRTMKKERREGWRAAEGIQGDDQAALAICSWSAPSDHDADAALYGSAIPCEQVYSCSRALLRDDEWREALFRSKIGSTEAVRR